MAADLFRRYLLSMPGKCSQCGSKTYLGRTTMHKDSMEIQNIPCTVCHECGYEQIGQQAQKRIGKLLERAAKGKLKSRLVVM
jgi:YgiT-type zinc finger domain-containing protein